MKNGRFQNYDHIWINWAGRQVAGYFLTYCGSGNVKTSSELGAGKVVPKSCIKRRTEKGAAV